jgi:large subunit ribosomal protein L1
VVFVAERSSVARAAEPVVTSGRATRWPDDHDLRTRTKENQMKRSKAYRQAAEKIDPDRLYSPSEAVGLAKDTATTKFDPTVEVALRLGVDPRKADQMVRGTVNLPNGTGKTARVLVFATGDRAAEATAAGADYVGSDDLLERIQGGFLDFDAVVATPDLMGKVGRLGRVLGPRGLMPNPKTGTVTTDVAKAVTEIKGGKIEFRVDRHGNLHFVIGKASFTPAALVENYAAALDEVLRLKPSAAKGKYLKKVAMATSMGPAILVDPAKTRGLTEELEPATA